MHPSLYILPTPSTSLFLSLFSLSLPPSLPLSPPSPPPLSPPSPPPPPPPSLSPSLSLKVWEPLEQSQAVVPCIRVGSRALVTRTGLWSAHDQLHPPPVHTVMISPYSVALKVRKWLVK